MAERQPVDQMTDEELQKANEARREVLPPAHPAALMFPMMSDAELDEMAADIKANGLREPIVFWVDNSEARNNRAEGPFPLFLLDGRNRVEALRRLGRGKYIKPHRNLSKACIVPTRVVDAIKHDHYVAGVGWEWVTEVDPWEYVMSANAHRRHLTPEQKREAIALLIKNNPKSGDREIARKLKVSPTTVGEARRKVVPFVQTGQVEHLPIERARGAVRANPGASVSTIAETAKVGRATAQRALKTAHLAPPPAKPSEAKTEPPPAAPPEPEPPPREPSIETMSPEDIRKWIKSLWKDYGRKRLTPGMLSPNSFKNLVAGVLFKTSTPSVRKVIVEIMAAEVGK